MKKEDQATSVQSPLSEYRLVKRAIRQWNGTVGHGAAKHTTGYDVILQQRWSIQSGRDIDYEWRDCETIVDEEVE